MSKILDVAIIGAGASGGYCAYRLTADTRLSVALFEASARVGGRLWSHHWAEADALVELGGEAFSPMHANVAGLVRKLNLPAVPHKEFNALRRLYLRDRMLAFPDLMQRSSFPGAASGAEPKVRYFLDPGKFLAGKPQTDQAADGIDDPFTEITNRVRAWLPSAVRDALDDLMAAIDQRLTQLSNPPGPDGSTPPTKATPNPDGSIPLSMDDALTLVDANIYRCLGAFFAAMESATMNVAPSTSKILSRTTMPVHDFEMWSFLVRDFGQEAYELFRAAGYSNTAALYFNLVELLEILFLGPTFAKASPNFISLEGGFDGLPKAMLAEAERKGAKVTMEARLRGIRRDKDSGVMTLTFRKPGGGTFQRKARKVIMAAPVSLFDADIALKGFDRKAKKCFARRRKGVISVPAGKLFLTYPTPWWAKMSDLPPDIAPDDALYGYANTDMPSRAVYYKGTCRDGMGLITGALTDGINSEFWTSFLASSSPAYPGTAPDSRFRAPAMMVDACHRILNLMHKPGLHDNLQDVPKMAMYHQWAESGGGWCAWRLGRDVRAEAAALRRPFTTEDFDQGLYCCGDSVAERHGWVENVLESAEHLLNEAFGLGPADWLPGEWTH